MDFFYFRIGMRFGWKGLWKVGNPGNGGKGLCGIWEMKESWKKYCSTFSWYNMALFCVFVFFNSFYILTWGDNIFHVLSLKSFPSYFLSMSVFQCQSSFLTQASQDGAFHLAALKKKQQWVSGSHNYCLNHHRILGFWEEIKRKLIKTSGSFWGHGLDALDILKFLCILWSWEIFWNVLSI